MNSPGGSKKIKAQAHALPRLKPLQGAKINTLNTIIMSNVSSIIGYAETQTLKSELNDLLSTETNYDEVEDLLLSYGLEMDYFFDLI